MSPVTPAEAREWLVGRSEGPGGTPTPPAPPPKGPLADLAGILDGTLTAPEIAQRIHLAPQHTHDHGAAGSCTSKADVAPTSARPRPVWFFDHHRADPAVPETPAQRRARLRDDVFTNAERFVNAARGLRCREEDLDLALELYSRALARLDAATDAFDAELDKTTIPTPHLQHRNP